MNEELIKALRIAFASEYAFVIKAQNFHWNIEGIHFVSLHELFGKIYEEAYSSIDDFAENIRKLGGYTPASFNALSMLSTVDREDNLLSAEEMIAELLQDSDKMGKVLGLVYDLSEKYKERGLSNFIADRQDAHKKHSWMLRSLLK